MELSSRGEFSSATSFGENSQPSKVQYDCAALCHQIFGRRYVLWDTFQEAAQWRWRWHQSKQRHFFRTLFALTSVTRKSWGDYPPHSFGDHFKNEAVRGEGDDATCKHIRSDKGISNIECHRLVTLVIYCFKKGLKKSFFKTNLIVIFNFLKKKRVFEPYDFKESCTVLWEISFIYF